MDGEAVVRFGKTTDATHTEVDRRFLIGSKCDLMRSRCESVLAKQGYDCELAIDGFQAFELITMSRFSAIILDQALRYFTGAQLVALSRFVPRLQNTPFFVFCLSKELDDVKKRLSGVDLVSVLAKPPSAQQLNAILKETQPVR